MQMSKVIHIRRCFELFDETFSPKVIGELNGQMLLAVKCEGDKVPWHKHENEDEMFLVVEGVLEIHERDQRVLLEPGEFYIVRRGVEHRIVPRGQVQLLLFEPAGIKHTGKVASQITKTSFDRLET
jgi:mannose-6-phosphate isomerase-like protein (cupin superfamily)